MEKQLEFLACRMIGTCVPISSWNIAKGVDASKEDVFADRVEWDSFDSVWGENPGTYWLKASVVVPEYEAGFQAVLDIKMNAEYPECHVKYPWTVGLTMHFEGLLYLDGKPWHGLDPNRSCVILPQDCAGKTYEILIEAYTRTANPKNLDSSLKIISQKIQSLYYDVFNLKKLIDGFGKRVGFEDPLQLMNSKKLSEEWDYEELQRRLEKIDQKVCQLLEDHNELSDSDVEKIQGYLNCEYEKLSNPIARQSISLVGHCHIDSVWLWTLSETIRKVGRTFSTMLRHMEKYPEFTYLQSSPFLYELCRENYPGIYNEVLDWVRGGRWEAEGGMYVEADCNMPCGESLCRQLLYGQRFFKEISGRYSKTLWLPDVFGFTGALPQLLRQAGVELFYTCKVRRVKGKPNPYCNYYWEGIDGTKVMAHFQTSYISWGDPAMMLGVAERNSRTGKIPENLQAYGFGDGGGGATDDDIELARRWKDLPFFPEVKFNTAQGFVGNVAEEYYQQENDIPVFCGEQYLAYHLGTFTSVAKVKLWNRRSEEFLHNAGLLASLATIFRGEKHPVEKLEECWKKLLYLQFHDILPGSSCVEVYDESEEVYDEIVGSTREISNGALENLSDEDMGFSVFNPLPFTYSALVDLPHSLSDNLSQTVLTVTGDKKNYGWCKNLLPWTFSKLELENCEGGAFSWDKNTLITPFWEAKFNDKGEISSLVEKSSGKEYCKGLLNSLRTYIDHPTALDPWELNTDVYDNEFEVFGGKAAVEVIAEGPILFIIRRTLKSEKSLLKQDVVFSRFEDKIDFVTYVDWHEKHKLLKACFELDVDAEFSRAETAFGYHKRPMDPDIRKEEGVSETPMHRWVEVSGRERGVAFINDCKYGYDAFGNNVNITLLKSAGYAQVNIDKGKGPLSTPDEPHAWADQGEHVFTYSLLPHSGNLSDGKVIKSARAFNNSPYLVNKSFSVPVFVQSDKPNIIIYSIKQAEDSDGFVLRVYEAAGADTSATLEFCSMVCCSECSILEEDISEKKKAQKVDLAFHAFELKNLKVTLL